VQASRRLPENRDRLAAAVEELADVLSYGLALANELDIDVSDAIRAKMIKNAAKYPVDKYRGRYGPQDDGWPNE
jgi:NTP pyrophosphatase (non-canonical NTP hydrolase)